MEQTHRTFLETRLRESEIQARESETRARASEVRANERVRDCSIAVNELTLTKQLLEVISFSKDTF